MTTFDFNRTALHATQPKLHSMFENRLISRRADVVWPTQSCNLTPLEYYLWGDVKDKCYTPIVQLTIDALKDNIRIANGEIQMHTIDNVLKNLKDRVGYYMASRGSHLIEVIFHSSY